MAAEVLTCKFSGRGRRKPHTIASVHSSIGEACQSLESQIAGIEAENVKALAEVQEVIGTLSDLRHGRFAQPASGEELGEEVLASLRQLDAVCSNPAG